MCKPKVTGGDEDAYKFPIKKQQRTRSSAIKRRKIDVREILFEWRAKRTDTQDTCQMIARAKTMRLYLHYLGKISDWIGNKTLQNGGVTLCNTCVCSSNVLFYVKKQR